jgi:hypothetical protein
VRHFFCWWLSALGWWIALVLASGAIGGAAGGGGVLLLTAPSVWFGAPLWLIALEPILFVALFWLCRGPFERAMAACHAFFKARIDEANRQAALDIRFRRWRRSQRRALNIRTRAPASG